MRLKKPILLVGDSEVNGLAARHALDELGMGNRLIAATRPEAMTYLRTAGEQRPGVVLLSVDESDGEGLATLRTIKQDDQLRSIPVVVLGPSGDSRMIDESFGLGAAGYINRSPDRMEFTATMRTLYEYWSLSELPK